MSNYERKRIEGDQGIWYCTKKTNAAFMALTDKKYSERIAYLCLDEFEDKHKDFLRNADLETLKLEGNALLSKYNKPENFDKLAMANQKVDNLKYEVNENVQKMIENGDNLEDLEDQTKRMNNMAGQYNKQAKSVERIMWWKKTRNLIVIVSIVVIVIVIIILIIVL